MANAKNFRDLDTKFIQLERTISINNQSISTIKNQKRFAFQRVIDCDGTDDRCLESNFILFINSYRFFFLEMMQRQQLFFHPTHLNLDTSEEYDIGKNFGVGEKCNEIHITDTGIYRFTVRVNVFFQPNDKTKRLLKRLGGTLYFDLIQRQEGSVNWSRVNVRIEVNANNNSQFTRRSGLPSEELRLARILGFLASFYLDLLVMEAYP